MTPERWRQVEELYHSALERKAEERGAFLDGPAAPIRNCSAKLSRCWRTSGSLLGASGFGTAGAEAGARLGVYGIVSKLGEGGMGVVYLAQDTKLNRPVAIKLLSDELADAAARRRFQREAQTASSLNHPHILTVYDIGEFSGRQYLVTEFVDGGTLRDWAVGRKATWRQANRSVDGRR